MRPLAIDANSWGSWARVAKAKSSPTPVRTLPSMTPIGGLRKPPMRRKTERKSVTYTVFITHLPSWLLGLVATITLRRSASLRWFVGVATCRLIATLRRLVAALGRLVVVDRRLVVVDRRSRRLDVYALLALFHGLDEGGLSVARSHEVELGVVEKRLKLVAWFPVYLHAGDVLCRELVGLFHALARQRDIEIAQVAKADFLALEQLLTHAVYGEVEDGSDVGSAVHRAMAGDVAGKLLDVHHLAILRGSKSLLGFGLHQVEVGLLGCIALLLSQVDALLGLVDFQ